MDKIISLNTSILTIILKILNNSLSEKRFKIKVFDEHQDGHLSFDNERNHQLSWPLPQVP